MFFETWKYKGTTFLAVKQYQGSVMVVDEHKNNYGSWYDTESFRKRQSSGDVEPIGKIGRFILGL